MHTTKGSALSSVRQILKRYLRVILGVALLAALLSQIQWDSLMRAVTAVNGGFFTLAVVIAGLANLVCAFRWARIANLLGVQLSKDSAVNIYFRGVAANTILPGGIIGGDLYRSVVLCRYGATKLRAAAIVFLDRVSGLWALSLFSLLAIGILFLSGPPDFSSNKIGMVLYASFLITGGLLPLSLIFVKKTEFSVLRKTLIFSWLSASFSVASFYLCLLSVGVEVSLLSVFIVSTGVFLGASLPASIGGFGSRELASVFFLSFFGVTVEESFLASVLFGLTGSIQGAIAIVLDRAVKTKR